MKNLEKFTSIASVILAIAMVVVAIFSYKTAQTANQIAQTATQIAQNSYEIAQNSYEIAYQTNLPIISAVSTLYYDEAEDWWTEELIVNNDGFPLRGFECSTLAVMGIDSAGNDTYIPLYGYFGIQGDYTGNSKGLLVSMSEKGNYSLYSSIQFDFWKEASKDGYQPYIWLYRIMWLHYKDYTGEDWRPYYYVSSSGSNEVAEDLAREILNSAYANAALMWNEGLNCYISALNGTELWHWYKGKYLG